MEAYHHQEKGWVMKSIKFLSGLFVLGGLCFFVLAGCRSGPEIELPDSMPDIVAAYKQVSVYADSPWARSTGIKIKKGDIFSTTTWQKKCNGQNFAIF